MTFEEIMQRAIFQYNADWDDYEDYAPHVDAYVNDGYDQLLYALTEYHLDETAAFYTLVTGEHDNVAPGIPAWTHPGICDYATYMLYRNGNPQKQQRGMAYYQRFMEILAKCKDLASKLTVDPNTGEFTVSKETPPFINYRP